MDDDNLKPIGTLVLLMIIVLLMFTSCTDTVSTQKLLIAQGYSHVEITGMRPWMRSHGDIYSTGFRAVSPNGSVVTGAVTKGWFKGQTIRFD